MDKDKEQCPRFELCSAALCSLDPHPRRYWYADTEICGLRGNVPEWVRTQKKIQKVNADPHSYYTQKMLEAVQIVRKGMTGISCVGYYKKAEVEWLERREDRHSEFETSQNLGGEAGF